MPLFGTPTSPIAIDGDGVLRGSERVSASVNQSVKVSDQQIKSTASSVPTEGGAARDSTCLPTASKEPSSSPEASNDNQGLGVLASRDRLVAAAADGRKDAAEWLVRECHLDPNLRALGGRTAVQAASAAGRLAVLEWLVKEADGDVHLSDVTGMTPLHLAAAGGHKSVVEWLVKEAQASVSAVNAQLETPVYAAVKEGHKEVVEWLVKEGKSRLNHENAQGKTPFDVAEACRQTRLLAVLETPGSCSARSPFILAIETGRRDMIEWLIERCSVSVNLKMEGGRTPTHVAARCGNREIVELLKNKGANIDAEDADGVSPLHIAAEAGDLAMVKLLATKSSWSNVDAKGRSALHYANSRGHQDVVKFILDIEPSAVEPPQVSRTRVRLVRNLASAKGETVQDGC